MNRKLFFTGTTYEHEILGDEESILKLDIPQTHISFGFIAPELFTKEALHLNLLGEIIAGGRASRLAKILRYEKGLIYSVSFSRYGGQELGSWNIITATSQDKVQEVIDEIIKEIKNLQGYGIKSSELEFVKNKKIKSLKRHMQTSANWVDFHASAEVFSKIPYDINIYVKEIEATTIEDLKKIIDKYFSQDNWKLALCGKTKEESVKFNW